MELASGRSGRDLVHFIKLVFVVLRTRPLDVFSMTRNFLMFYASSILVCLNPFYKHKLVLGRNVRVQRLRSIRPHGKNANITLGDNSIIYENALIEAMDMASISIGACVVVGDCRISSRKKISIGERTLLSWNVFIQDYDSHPILPELRAEQVKRICKRFYPRFKESNLNYNEQMLEQWCAPATPIVIGCDVWIGAGVTILKGVTIGDGCIVASGSVVTRGQYPSRCLIAGNPAQVVKQI
jgi:acetyltransferase-like isoleucine patch superfamily enzyme